ncbi:MAG: dTDP-glucose 4,6-dehydratase [Candidatus Euphemobacter frigidus]|nr:dTDP-glucose 4,6-dehydratase [Candidatus Euphemobacter frigidus]MDP8274922.1 dTDP-glucose 4,6-dehydratase [Candidatus Euphemobacter frigidus]
MSRKILVTGGAGFIGSNFIHYWVDRYPEDTIINLDKLTYAGNLDNLKALEGNPRYYFVKGDISDSEVVGGLFQKGLNVVVNFAAETHVDRSIGDPDDFIRTDVYGTYVLLEAARHNEVECFIQISTDEVYGSVEDGFSRETDPLMPRNPYAASKAGADRLAYSYFATYDLPVIITRASNNFGPYQYPEKVIPLFVTNALDSIPLPLYGDGLNIRDWLFVDDHCRAVDLLIQRGEKGEVYNIGGGNLLTNQDLTGQILKYLGLPETLVRRVRDREGHDRRYALDSSKIKKLGWTPGADYDNELKSTIDWYRDNRWWWEKIKSGEFKAYYQKQYSNR